MTVYVGDLLTATAASVTGKPTPSRTWKWLRDGTAISGATSSSYTITDSDLDTILAVEQTETNVGGVARATSSTVGPVATYSPAGLFALAEPGVWYDPSDLTTLFQDTGGTIPVTTPGQTVALALDKSKGLVLGSELVGTPTLGSGWVSNGNGSWSITNAASTSDFRLDFGAIAGKTMRVQYTISGTPLSSVIFVLNSAPGFVSVGSFNFLTVPNAAFFIVRAVTGASITISNISVRELPGFHATQATTASRPTYGIVPRTGRRNLLTRTEEFNDAAWAKTGTTVATNAAIAPDSTTTADLLYPASSGNNRWVYQTYSGASAIYTRTVYAKASGKDFLCIDADGGGTNGVYFNLSTGAVGTVSAGYTASITSVGNGWYRCSVRNNSSATTSFGGVYAVVDADNSRAVTASGTNGILLWGAQLETGSSATAYQRVGSAFDVTEAGVQSLGYLSFDGVDDFLVTPTITPNIDKAQVFAGVRRFADTAGLIAEHSTDFNANIGSWVLATGTSIANALGNGFHSNSRGTAAATGATAGITPATFVPPVTAVLTTTHDISGDLSVARGNGVAGTNGTADKGTGNFLAYPLYIGRRGGAYVPFNGQIYSLLVRFGANLDQVDINRAERWVADKTGVTL